MQLARARRSLLLVTAFAAVATSCGGSDGSRPAAKGAIDGFSTARLERSLTQLDGWALKDPGRLRAAALAQLDTADPGRRFAALYALTLTADRSSAEALRAALTRKSSTERLLAAAALVGLGDTSGLPSLIDGLSSSDTLAYWDPPESAWAFAKEVLLASTGQDLGLRQATTLAAATAAQPAWRQWWAAQGPAFIPHTSSRFGG
jgi:hypothetical protein